MKKTDTKKEEGRSKTLNGVVVSTKMKDTATVLVERFVKHSKYQKFLKFSKKYKVHNPLNKFQNGDKVVIKEVKPISKDKRFVILN
jgi:small subunit ribosomal protein S17